MVRQNIFTRWVKPLYIAKKIGVEIDDDNNEVAIYDTPKLYSFNYQPISEASDIEEFGTKSTGMRVMTITNYAQYENMFNEFDLAYIDGASPDGEEKNGANANFRVHAVRYQNLLIKVYFISLILDNS